jgi:hypothetical protein
MQVTATQGSLSPGLLFQVCGGLLRTRKAVPRNKPAVSETAWDVVGAPHRMASPRSGKAHRGNRAMRLNGKALHGQIVQSHKAVVADE